MYRAKFGKGDIINIVSSIDVHILKMYLSATKKICSNILMHVRIQEFSIGGGGGGGGFRSI